MSAESRSIGGGLKLGAALLGGALLTMWLLEVADLLFFGGALDAYGIRPRSVGGLDGVVLAPLLHGDLAHLASNSVPFVALGLLVFLNGLHSFAVTTVLSVGLSGLVFGYLGYLLLRGYFTRSVGAILLALLLVVLCGGALWGLLPLQAGASWTAHLFGFLGGALSPRTCCTAAGL